MIRQAVRCSLLTCLRCGGVDRNGSVYHFGVRDEDPGKSPSLTIWDTEGPFCCLRCRENSELPKGTPIYRRGGDYVVYLP